MTEKRKARVGDTIRHNGKNPAYKAGEEFVVTEVVDTPGDPLGEYWVKYETIESDWLESAWESQFDIVEPEPELKKGDRVKLTPKNGGDTVIYGELQNSSRGALNEGETFVTIRESGTGEYIDAWFSLSKWNIEHFTPSTEDILNGLGENAYVAHRTDSEWRPYAKIDGEWHEVSDQFQLHLMEEEVAYDIDHRGFEIIFEGVKDE